MTTPDDSGSGQPPPPPGYAAAPSGYPVPTGYAAPPPGYGAGPPDAGPRMSNGLGVAALVIGLIALPFSFIVVGGVFGLFAAILGIAGRSRVKRGQAANPSVALAGIISGVLAMLIAIAVVVALVVAYNSDTGHKLRDCIKGANGNKVAEQTCQKNLGFTPTPSTNH